MEIDSDRGVSFQLPHSLFQFLFTNLPPLGHLEMLSCHEFWGVHRGDSWTLAACVFSWGDTCVVWGPRRSPWVPFLESSADRSFCSVASARQLGETLSESMSASNLRPQKARPSISQLDIGKNGMRGGFTTDVYPKDIRIWTLRNQ